MVDDEAQCRICVAKLSQRMQQGRHSRIARVNRCGTEPSVLAQHVCARAQVVMFQGVINAENCEGLATVPEQM